METTIIGSRLLETTILRFRLLGCTILGFRLLGLRSGLVFGHLYSGDLSIMRPQRGTIILSTYHLSHSLSSLRGVL